MLFNNINITNIDEQKTNIKEQGNSDIYLSLSENDIPAEWCQMFNTEWNSNLHSTWKPAKAIGKHILIECHHSTLHDTHMLSLKNTVVKANEQYRAFLKNQEKCKEEVKPEKTTKDILSNLQKKF